MADLKIIHIVLGKANPERMNGVNKVAHNLASAQVALGFNVEIWGITPKAFRGTSARSYQVQLFFPSKWFQPINGKLQQAVLKQDSTNCIFHIHGAFIYEFKKLSVFLYKHSFEYVYMPHGAFSQFALEKSKFIKKIYFNLFERNIIKQSKGVHFLGENQYTHFAKVYPGASKFIVPNGQNFEELETNIIPIKKQEMAFGFCGRMDIFYKGLDIMLPAFAKYKAAGGKAKLHLIGDGADMPKVKAQSKELKLDDSIVFYGSKFGDEKNNLIANMDVFLHPSRSEGSPTAVLEALGLGVGVIISKPTNFGAEVQQHQCGICLEQNTIDCLTKAMQKAEIAIEKDEWKQMGSNGKKLVKEQFNWQAISVRLIEHYRA